MFNAAVALRFFLLNLDATKMILNSVFLALPLSRFVYNIGNGLSQEAHIREKKFRGNKNTFFEIIIKTSRIETHVLDTHRMHAFVLRVFLDLGSGFAYHAIHDYFVLILRLIYATAREKKLKRRHKRQSLRFMCTKRPNRIDRISFSQMNIAKPKKEQPAEREKKK